MSVFFPTGRPPITYLFIECIGKVVVSHPDASMAEVIDLSSKLSECHFSIDQLEYVAGKLRILAQPPETGPALKQSSKLFVDFSDWFNALPNDTQCLVACDYNLEAARRLYCEADFEVAKVIIATKYEQMVKEQRAHFEAVLYGMGGHLGGDLVSQPLGPEVTFDLTDTSEQEAGLAELRSMGF